MSAGGIAPATGGKGPRGPFLACAAGISTLLDWSGRIIAAACLGVMFVALLLNVVLRYAFGSGIAWAYEIHALLLPWLVAGGIVIAAARGRNIAITLGIDLLAPGARRWLAGGIQAATVAIAASVLWSSQPILKAAQFQTLSTLGIGQIWGYSSLVYAFAGIAVIAVVDLLRTIGGEDVTGLDLGHTSLS